MEILTTNPLLTSIAVGCTTISALLIYVMVRIGKSARAELRLNTRYGKILLKRALLIAFITIITIFAGFITVLHINHSMIALAYLVAFCLAYFLALAYSCISFIE